MKSLKVRVTEIEEQLVKKDEEVKSLKAIAINNEILIREKDSKIEELRKKLESLGVFEK
jgi:hypothetical protein